MRIKVATKVKPMLCLKSLRGVVLFAVLGMNFQSVSGQHHNAPLLLHPRLSSNTLPVAAYRDIKVEEFRKLVIGAFEEARFSHVAVERTKDGATHYRFSYTVPVGKGVQNVALLVRVNETLDKRNRCAPCFLRLAELPDIPSLQRLPWMTQYALSSAIFPAIDRAFGHIRANGQAALDKNFPFDYQNQWHGERNLQDNAFVGIGFVDLKAATINAYRAAGFTLVSDAQADLTNSRSELVFSFPIDPDQTAGVVYKVIVAAQFNEHGKVCYPCELKESYDPYQQLPATGLTGMSSRLTLESRFTAARTLAFERLKQGLGHYLRPGTDFLVPPKSAPLGSPRPSPARFVVT